ncbi:MAG: ornithine acetyltransferase [Spirochaetae bacterium HGW-Spirochaetae-1]|jgi:glutamate N-acetyltransferase/amino-acid N-acetyltransferase|nr:MAG: ornithine acetyltransferase [Spirochaetae bacterium HGW-Spirochaetae-1]
MKVLQGGLENVPGFKFSALSCNIRYEGRLDYALIVSDIPCNAAGLFTTNRVSAAPVKLCRERIGNKIRGILINATNANACTGNQGYGNALTLTEDMAAKLGTESSSLLMCSTGIIGHQLPVEKMLAAHENLAGSLSRENGGIIPKAIMTTDTFPKSISVSFETSKGTYTIAGTTKGSGMIAPNMATMLAFIITDAPVASENLTALFRKAVKKTLNAITIDGDMSTNDTALILSPAGAEHLKEDGDLASFYAALEHVLMELAAMLVTDGEGATKLVRVRVTGAQNDDDAWRVARAVAQSALVKTAFFGQDPNWGRVACAAGYSGADVHEETLTISFGDITLLKNGTPVPFDHETLKNIMKNREFDVMIDLGMGTAGAMMMTCDFSYDYVKINAEYTT